MKKLFVSWQDPLERRWYPIGILTYDESTYRFCYTVGASEAKNFEPFFGMRKFDEIYESKDLFPLFSNRLLSRSRPEYSKFIDWLSLDIEEADPFVVLSLSGGLRQTDSLELFPCPVANDNGNYELKFFSRGLSHQPEATQQRVDKLRHGEKLFIMKDIQNPFDMEALVLRTDDPVTIVGYCPRYLTEDLNRLIEKNGPKQLDIFVDKVNYDAPLQFRLLCKIKSPWPKDFNACSNRLYHPLPESTDAVSSCGLS